MEFDSEDELPAPPSEAAPPEKTAETLAVSSSPEPMVEQPLLNEEQGLHTLQLVQEQSYDTEKKLSAEAQGGGIDEEAQIHSATQQELWATGPGNPQESAAASPFDAGVILALCAATLLKKSGHTDEQSPAKE